MTSHTRAHRPAPWALSLSLILAGLLAACGGAQQASPASAAPSIQHIRIAYSSASFAQIAALVAQDMGIFRSHGLDAEFILGPNGTPALIAGDVEVSMGSTEEIVAADEAGAHLETVATMVPFLQHSILARPEIKTIQDLKGKTIGVTKRGAIPDTVIRMALRDGGLDPDKDVTTVELGTTDKQIAALTAGSVFAASLSPPNNNVAERQGAHVLIDYRPMHIPYPAAQAYVNRDWAAKNDATVMALVRSLAEAEQTVRTNPDDVAKIYAKYAQTGDAASKEAVQQAIDAVPVKMLPTLEGIQAVQKVVAEKVPSAAAADPRKYFDDQYVLRLDKEGLYAKLGQ